MIVLRRRFQDLKASGIVEWSTTVRKKNLIDEEKIAE